MHVQALGHVVLKVRDVHRAEDFYSGTLGIPVAGRITEPVPMTFFTLGHHHDFAVMELGQHGPSPERHTAGLAHVAFKIGDSLDEFDSAKRDLEAAGAVILFELDHGLTQGMHMHDPDGNEVELFVDVTRTQKANQAPPRSRCR
jgi:catechol-2,3-dioxygenase